MCLHAWNRMLAVSLSLAGAGTLACLAALINTLVPQPLLAILGGLIVLGLAIVAVLSGYVWVCDKCEEHLGGRTDRVLGMEQEVPRNLTRHSKNKTRAYKGANGRGAAAQLRQPGPAADRYVEGLRGVRTKTDLPQAMSAEKQWHGQ